jgi:hypothetical protein
MLLRPSRSIERIRFALSGTRLAFAVTVPEHPSHYASARLRKEANKDPLLLRLNAQLLRGGLNDSGLSVHPKDRYDEL